MMISLLLASTLVVSMLFLGILKDLFFSLYDIFSQRIQVKMPTQTEDVSVHWPLNLAREDDDIGFYTTNQQRANWQYRYYAEMSNEAAKHVIDILLKEIRASRETIIMCMETYGDLFMSRWKKRNPENRAKALEVVAENSIQRVPWIALMHQFSPESFQPEIIRAVKKRHAILLPWLDVETLQSNVYALFALLHYRTYYPPESWAAFDNKQLDMGWKAGLFSACYSSLGVRLHGPNYGMLVQGDLPAFQRHDLLGFPRAVLLFEAQAALMIILRRIVVSVLSGTTLTEGNFVPVIKNNAGNIMPPQATKWKELTATCNFRATDEIELTSPYMFPSFSPPPHFDLDHIISLANARAGAARDHLWQLQCNPAYMRRQLKEYMGPTATDLQCRYRVSRFILHLADEAWSHMMWQYVVAWCEKLKHLKLQFAARIQPGKSLPPEYKKSFGELELMILLMAKRAANDLFQDMISSTTLTGLFTLKPSPESRLGLAPYIPDRSPSFHADPLLWCMVLITKAPLGTNYLFDEALCFRHLQQHLAKSHFHEKKRVDEFTYKSLADISAFSEILSSVRWERPRTSCAKLEDIMTRNHEEVWNILASNDGILAPVSACEEAENILLKFLTVEPPKGPKNLQWLQRHGETRRILERFWSAVRTLTGMQLERRGLRNGEIKRNLEVITVTQSAEYRQIISNEEAEILDATEGSTEAQESRYNKTIWSGETSTTVMEPTRQKTKTRPRQSGENNTSDLIDEDGVGDRMKALDLEETPALIETTKRALELIKLIFPKAPKELSGSLQWTHFIQAMSDLGFVARQAGGSAVSFEAAGQGKIVFHKPHPHTKIASIELQIIGVRMFKWFGWKRENFVLKKTSS